MNIHFLLALATVFTIVISGNLLVLRLKHRRVDDGSGNKRFLRAESYNISDTAHLLRFLASSTHSRLGDPVSSVLVYLIRSAVVLFVLNAFSALVLKTWTFANA